MEMKILWIGAIFLGGWLWFYLFLRQFLFNLIIAYPLTRKMRATKEDLITKAADKYTTTSMVVCSLFIVIVLFVVLRFCKPYMLAGFFAGAVIGLATYAGNLKLSNRAMFDTFCATYYNFVPDDELRTAMYNKKPSQMKLRLHDMELPIDFIPDFKK